METVTLILPYADYYDRLLSFVKSSNGNVIDDRTDGGQRRVTVQLPRRERDDFLFLAAHGGCKRV